MMLTTQDFYDTYQTDPAALTARHRQMISLIAAYRPRKVLDVGCGRGTLLAALRSEAPGATYRGLEVSETLCGLARADGLDVSRHDLTERLPFEDGSFDMVILGEVIEHMFDPDAALDDIHRVLQPGGRLVITTPNLACWLNRIVMLAGIQPLFTETSTRKKYGRRLRALGQGSTEMHGHIRVMTTTALTELLEDRRFRIASLHGYRFEGLTQNPVSNAIDGFFSRFPALACGIIAVAEQVDGGPR